MAWKENLKASDGNRGPTPKTKSSLNKLLEVVRSERLMINSVGRTSKTIQNGKDARKFPDSKRDFRIEFTITSQTGKISLPICYEQFAGEEEDPPLRYNLATTAIQRYSSEGNILDEEPGDMSYCCCPILEHRTERKKKLYGFWLRCFGPKVIFRITIVITLYGLHHLTKCNASKLEPSAELSDDEVVCLKVFEFINCPRKKSEGQIVKECQLASKIFPSLYTDEDYKTFMTTARSTHPNELANFMAQSMKKGSSRDLRVVAHLEQSLEACRMGNPEEAKQMVKSAVDLVNKCSSKVLLTGRAYLYLARIHLKDGCLGNVEECLCLARKKLQNIESCEDIGDLSYQEGEMLIAFIKRVPRLRDQLIPKARSKFEEAAVHYKEGLNIGGAVNKLCHSHIQLASLTFQGAAKGSIMTYDAIAMAQGHVKVVQAHLSDLSQQVRFEYFLCYSKLLLEMQLLEQARENLKVALQISEDSVIGEDAILNSELVEEIYDQLHGNSSQHTEEDVDQFAAVARTTAADDNDIIYLGYLGDVSD